MVMVTPAGVKDLYNEMADTSFAYPRVVHDAQLLSCFYARYDFFVQKKRMSSSR